MNMHQVEGKIGCFDKSYTNEKDGSFVRSNVRYVLCKDVMNILDKVNKYN